jgi:prepilin-type N-terminal cleavage/methylation domain-containing protein
MKRSLRGVHGSQGFSLLELTMGLAIAGVLGSLAVGSFIAMRSQARALGGARYLAARLSEERVAAVRRGAAGGLFFTRVGDGYVYQRAIDGNGNGLRTEDLRRGLDRLVDPPLPLSAHSPGIDFAIRYAVPDVDGEGPGFAAGADPVRIGGSRFLSFSATGTGASGTLYLATDDGRQLAVRVLGPTGRVRVFEFRRGHAQWLPR